jgi:hypothetical protein
MLRIPSIYRLVELRCTLPLEPENGNCAFAYDDKDGVTHRIQLSEKHGRWLAEYFMRCYLNRSHSVTSEDMPSKSNLAPDGGM